MLRHQHVGSRANQKFCAIGTRGPHRLLTSVSVKIALTNYTAEIHLKQNENIYYNMLVITVYSTIIITNKTSIQWTPGSQVNLNINKKFLVKNDY